jgi:hypothetical protein
MRRSIVYSHGNLRRMIVAHKGEWSKKVPPREKTKRKKQEGWEHDIKVWSHNAKVAHFGVKCELAQQ